MELGVGCEVGRRRIHFKVTSKQNGSMTSKSPAIEGTILVQYCRSCETHSWCTHHDESKYHDTFVRCIAELTAAHFPALEVIGNLVPSHLIPFKIAENKYIDANTNKYVVYPMIGSFEVRFQGQTLFSKKETHTWPHLPALLQKIAAVVDPVLPLPERSPQKQVEKSPKKQGSLNSFAQSEERKPAHKEQPKGFTLTDHFKMYRPKNRLEEKDWLTEKHESQASYKQISEMGRVDSRQKSEPSQTSDKRSQLLGETKLKELLRTKGLQLREQGRKEMIIKLDSIEQQNQYEQGAAATQRTQEIVKKSNKMQQFEEDMSSLENKFISFENRVQDIHNRNKEFQYREAGSSEKQELGKGERSSPSKKEEVGRLADKTNKLEQYLAFSQHEKNEKLNRIYGEWKLIKQFGTKNKKPIKKKGEELESSEDDTSQAHSQSPSTANILAFRPKVERVVDRSHPRPHPQQKYSSIERYHQQTGPASPSETSKIKTQDNFYHREDDHGTRLIKKGLNASSMDALRSLAQNQKPSEPQISSSTKANLHKISNRISNIQEQLKKHKEWKESFPGEPRKLSRDHSEHSTHNSNKLIRNYGAPVQRSSHQSGSKGKGQNVSGEKKASQFMEQRKIGESVIEEEFEPMESKFVSRHNKYESRQSEVKREGKAGERRELGLPRKISEKKDQSKAFREKILPPRESKLLKEQLKLRQSKETNPRFSKESSQSNPFHPLTKKQPLIDLKPKEKSIDHKQNSQTRLSELKPLEKKISKQTLNKMRLSDSKETVIRPKRKESHKQEKETPRKGQLQAEPEIHSEEEDSDREQNYHNGSEDQLEGSRFSAGKQSLAQKSSLSKQDSRGRQLEHRKYGRIMKNKGSLDRENTQYDQESEHPTQGNQYQDGEQDTVGNYSQARQAEDVKTETKMRKTLGYFKAEALCFRGAKTSESKNRSDRIRQEVPLHNTQTHQSEGPIDSNDRVGSRNREHLEESADHEDEDCEDREDLENLEAEYEYRNGEYDEREEQNDRKELNCRKMASNDSESQQERVSLDKDISKNDRTNKSVEFDTVEGWKLNTEEEYEDNQFEPEDPEEGEPQKEEAQADSGEKSLRRNSLDKELEEDEKREAVTERQNEKLSRESGRIVKVGRGSSQTERAKKESAKLDNSQPMPTHDITLQDQSLQNSPNIDKKKDQDGLQMAQVDKNEGKLENKQELMNSGFKLDASSSIKPDLEAKMVDFYMKTVQQAVCRQIILEDCGVEMPVEHIEEPSEEKELEKHIQGKETASDPSLKDIEDMGQDSKLNNKTEEENNKTQITPIASLELASNINEKQTSSNKDQNYVSKVAPLKQNSALTNSSPFKQSPSSKVGSPQRSEIKRETFSSKLADNVYSQSIDTNKFKEIGVQKELTIEVSIQTDTPFDADSPIQVNAHSVHITHRPTLTQQSPIRADFEGTIRNNFLSEPDPSEIVRAKIIDKIYSQTKEDQTNKFPAFVKGDDSLLVRQSGDVAKLGCIYPGGLLLGDRSLEVEAVSSRFNRLLKVLDILAEQSEWLLRRLFEDGRGAQKERGFGVWLCKDCQWECFIVDDCVRIDSQGQPSFTRHAGGQYWANILEKALAISMGGYEHLAKAESGKLFTLLTGCNALSLKVKQDPSKNGKLLQLISECLRKNYPIHAEKGWLGGETDRREPVYRLLAIRKAVADQEALLELSQDGRESFWLRLSKFTAEFGRVQVLQLRMGHNFAHVELGTPLHGQLSVVELDFIEEGQGCVTLSYIGCEGPLKAYLYRQEKSRLLKLVGQAKERSKSHLFFECNFTEGRYFLFAQAQDSPARLAYLGQGRPSLKITEEIHSEGLKNDVAEYLPVEQERGRENETGNSWRRGGPRLRDNFVESRLREEFVDYVMGRSKRQ